jgi:hypothetical protein
MTEINLIQQKIHEVRGEMVMFDYDLAMLYEVDTRSLNQAVKRNIERFPIDFMFRLTIKGQLQEMRERIGEHDVQLNKIYDTIEHLLDLTMNRVKWNERNIIGFKEDKKPNI